MSRKKKIDPIGYRLIEFIRKNKLFSVECPAAPNAGCLTVWTEDAADRITEFVNQSDPPRAETVPAASLAEAQRAQFEPFGISEQLPRG